VPAVPVRHPPAPAPPAPAATSADGGLPRTIAAPAASRPCSAGCAPEVSRQALLARTSRASCSRRPAWRGPPACAARCFFRHATSTARSPSPAPGRRSPSSAPSPRSVAPGWGCRAGCRCAADRRAVARAHAPASRQWRPGRRW
jgi:hypothetical protein